MGELTFAHPLGATCAVMDRPHLRVWSRLLMVSSIWPRRSEAFLALIWSRMRERRGGAGPFWWTVEWSVETSVVPKRISRVLFMVGLLTITRDQS